MSDLDPLRNLAQALAMDPGQPVTMTKGLVQAYSIGGQPPTLSIYLSGDTSTLIQGVRFIDSYSPAIGDVVQVIKQGPMLLVLGQIAGGANHAANGWVTPLLSSGCSVHPSDPPYYRLILDNGSKKVQLRGQILLTGTPGTLWQMPVDLRPAFDLGHLTAARDPAGGATTMLIWPRGNDSGQSGANVGYLMLQNHTTGVTGVSSSGGSTTGVTDHNHTHRSSDFNGNVQVYSDMWTTQINSGATSHSHSTPNHTHTMTSVTAPGWVSLNGIEYFI